MQVMSERLTIQDELILYNGDAWRLEEVFSAKQVVENAREQGAKISSDFAGETVHVLDILLGGTNHTTAVTSAIDSRVRVVKHVARLTSYGDNATSSSSVMRDPLPLPDRETLADKHVVVMDDLLDSAKTALWIGNRLTCLDPVPGSLSLAVALSKPIALKKIANGELSKFTTIHSGLEAPDDWLVGNGMDWGGFYRNLPNIMRREKVDVPDELHEQAEATRHDVTIGRGVGFVALHYPA